MSAYSWQPAVLLCQVCLAHHFCRQYEVEEDALTVSYTLRALRTARG